MFEYLNGKLVKISPTNIVIDVVGIGYLISVANPYAWSALMNTEVKIYVHQVIREDAHSLYGFVNEAEKALFLRLISVSGIGPKSALAIIAAADNEGLITAIDNSDIKYLTKFPGVGKKTAMQIEKAKVASRNRDSLLEAAKNEIKKFEETTDRHQK